VALTKVDGEGVGTLDSLNITESNNGATEGPSFELHRNSTSPADNDVLGALLYTGKSSTGAEKTYSSMNGFISNVANANASGGLIFNTRNSDTLAERMRIDAAGAVKIKSTGGATPTYSHTNNGEGITFRYNDDSGARAADIVAIGNNPAGATMAMRFFINPASTDAAAERMRIASGGNWSVSNVGFFDDGRNSNAANNASMNYAGLFLSIASFQDTPMLLNRMGNNGTIISFRQAGNTVGTVSVTGSNTAYNTSSDYRLKTNVSYDWDATTRLKQLKPARFEWIADGDNAVPVDGFLAHEAAIVCPESVTGTKDEVEVWKDSEELPDGVSVGDNKLDDDGNTIPVMQGIDQSKLVPLLVKTIQELEARIAALETA